MYNNETKTYKVECLPKFLPLEINNEGIKTLKNYINSLIDSVKNSSN